jgi:hypothetical protein
MPSPIRELGGRTSAMRCDTRGTLLVTQAREAAMVGETDTTNGVSAALADASRTLVAL